MRVFGDNARMSPQRYECVSRWQDWEMRQQQLESRLEEERQAQVLSPGGSAVGPSAEPSSLLL